MASLLTLHADKATDTASDDAPLISEAGTTACSTSSTSIADAWDMSLIVILPTHSACARSASATKTTNWSSMSMSMTRTSLCLYSIPFIFHPTALLLSIRFELLSSCSDQPWFIPDHAKRVWTTRFKLLVHYSFTFYRYHQSLVGLSGAESTRLDIGLRPGT